MSTLTDEQWALVAPLFPPPSPYDRNRSCGCGRGRPSLDQTDPGHNRRVLDAILYKLRERLPWYDLPTGFPPWPTCYRRYRRWKKDGVMDQVFVALFLHLRDIGELDLVDALHSGRLAIHRQDGRLLLQATDPALQGTWQLDVARLFFALVLQKNFAFFNSKIPLICGGEAQLRPKVGRSPTDINQKYLSVVVERSFALRWGVAPPT